MAATMERSRCNLVAAVFAAIVVVGILCCYGKISGQSQEPLTTSNDLLLVVREYNIYRCNMNSSSSSSSLTLTPFVSIVSSLLFNVC